MLRVELRIHKDGELVDSQIISGNDEAIFYRYESWLELARTLMGDNIQDTCVDMSILETGDVIASHSFTE